MKIDFTKEEIEDLLINLDQCQSEGYLNFGDPAYSAMMKLLFAKDDNESNLFRPKWINIKEKLPKPYEHVLVNNDDEGVFRAYRDDHEFTSWQSYPLGSYAGDGCVFGITHWMPLPKPPGKDDE